MRARLVLRVQPDVLLLQLREEWAAPVGVLGGEFDATLEAKVEGLGELSRPIHTFRAPFLIISWLFDSFQYIYRTFYRSVTSDQVN